MPCPCPHLFLAKGCDHHGLNTELCGAHSGLPIVIFYKLQSDTCSQGSLMTLCKQHIVVFETESLMGDTLMLSLSSIGISWSFTHIPINLTFSTPGETTPTSRMSLCLQQYPATMPCSRSLGSTKNRSWVEDLDVGLCRRRSLEAHEGDREVRKAN